jgi:uncharacterized small protein (DUF1192 family)
MFEDEDRKVTVAQGFQNLEKLSVDEIGTYIDTLKAEIQRAETELKKKKASIDTASAIFK